MSVVKKQRATKLKFGQLVIGPPGSGKTTYCTELNKLFNKLERKSIVINLDPANDNMGYTPSVDVMQLITVEDVMENYELGPNGALMFCMEYIEKNVDWLLDKLNLFTDTYFIFDLPGQVELYTHHKAIKNIFNIISTTLDCNLCSIHLVDSHYCSEPTKFISTLLLSLSTMIQMELPHVNILSKADQLIQHSDKLHFNLEFYTEVLNLDYLLDLLNTDKFSSKYKKLNAALTELVENYGLVSFHLLDVHREKDLLNIKNAADKANGFVYGSGEERNIQALLSCAIGARTQTEQYDTDVM